MKRMLTIFGLLSFSLTFAAVNKFMVSDAQTVLVTKDLCKLEYRTRWITGLIRDGVSQVGDLNLIQLKKEMEAIACTVNFGPTIKSADGLRQSAVNYPSRKEIVFNIPQGRHQEITPDSLIVHEALGALGYNDTNYQLTAALQSLNLRVYNGRQTSNDKQYLTSEDSKMGVIRLMQNRIFTNKVLRQGGADAGGGDFNGALTKVLMMLDLDNAISLDRILGRKSIVDYADIETFILTANIEVEHGNVDESSMHIDCRKGSCTLYIPDTTYVVYKGQRRLPSDNGVRMIRDYLEKTGLAISSR